MAKKKFYITTAIDYVNGRPHIGHAFEKVLADALSRYHKLCGKKVFLLTGTDENAQKNALVAKEQGRDIQEFVDENSQVFIELCKKLDVNFDRFIRTTEVEHVEKSRELFKLVYDRGDIYKGKYEGLYCSGCEEYKTEKELVDGKCPEHDKAPEEISEEAYFFKMNKYEKQVEKFVKDYIVPETRKKEILSRITHEGIRDLCVSRLNLDWGIDNPIDPKFKIYVWFDALINYISGSNDNWPADIHVIGKGINWFHSVIWPSMLFAAGLPLPKKLLVHGYINLDGGKISKSKGNTIDPIALAETYSSDSVRYSLLRCSVFEDSDYSEEILVERHNSELANKLGNLVSRVSSLAENYGITKTPNRLLKKFEIKNVQKHFESYELDKALGEIFAFVDICNEYVQSKKPWETKDKKVLYELVESLREIAKYLEPFIPQAAQKIQEVFKTDTIKKAPVLFTKLESPGQKPNLNKSEEPQEIMEGVTAIKQINFDDFEKLDMRVAEIETIEEIEGADKLYKLNINTGIDNRIICAGIKPYYSHDDLRGKKIIVLTNLKPRKLRGVESKGMLLAASNENHSRVSLLTPDQDMEVGSVVG